MYHDGALLARVSLTELEITVEVYRGNGHALVMMRKVETWAS
jgi:hypothetical protein